MESFGPALQEKFMKNKAFLVIHLDIKKLTDILEKLGYTLEIKNSTAEEQKYSDYLMRSLFGANKTPHLSTIINGKKIEWSLLSGTWSRILFNFMSPKELVEHSKFYINQASS